MLEVPLTQYSQYMKICSLALRPGLKPVFSSAMIGSA